MDHGSLPIRGQEDGWIRHSDVSWVMTHRACGDEMQTDGGEYRHMEQDGRTIHDICIVRALVLYHCGCRVPHYINISEVP